MLVCSLPRRRKLDAFLSQSRVKETGVSCPAVCFNSPMPQFSRTTVLSATDILANWTHASFDRFALEYSLEDVIPNVSTAKKAMELAKHLIRNPEQETDTNENLTDAVVGRIVAHAIERSLAGYPAAFSFESFQQSFPALHRALERDGFTVEQGALRRTLPNVLDLPAADDEVHMLLDAFGFATPKGHLDQGIAAHVRGDWAAANAQFRPFVESLFDSMAQLLAQRDGVPPPHAGNPSRIWLANRAQPILIPALNEWNGQGQGFMEAFYRRLHPAGAHPGLSDEDDSTFRLHFVLLVARTLLRRL